MTIEQQAKFAAHIQRLLKVRSVSFPVANTEKGPVSVKHIKDQAGYELILDAVPLEMGGMDNESNRELKAMLEKYWFETEIDLQQVIMTSRANEESIARDSEIMNAPFVTPEQDNGDTKTDKSGNLQENHV